MTALELPAYGTTTSRYSQISSANRQDVSKVIKSTLMVTIYFYYIILYKIAEILASIILLHLSITYRLLHSKLNFLLLSIKCSAAPPSSRLLPSAVRIIRLFTPRYSQASVPPQNENLKLIIVILISLSVSIICF